MGIDLYKISNLKVQKKRRLAAETTHTVRGVCVLVLCVCVGVGVMCVCVWSRARVHVGRVRACDGPGLQAERLISDIMKLRVLPDADGRAFAITFKDGEGMTDVEVNYEARTPTARGACVAARRAGGCDVSRDGGPLGACVCVCVCVLCVRACVRALARRCVRVADEIFTKLEYILNSNGRSDAVVGATR